MASSSTEFVESEAPIYQAIRAKYQQAIAWFVLIGLDFIDTFIPDSLVAWFRKPPPVPSPPLVEEAILRVEPGNELEDILRKSLLNKRVMMMEGPPGVGKTFTALKVLRELTRQKAIRGFVYFACTKALTPDQIWQPELVMTTDAEGRIKTEQNPPEWRKLLAGNFAPLMTASEAELRELDNLENSIVIFVDEASRASSVMLDSILTPMESRVVTIDGRQVVAPGLLWLLGGNPAGMDQTATGYSPPLLSRFDVQATLTNPNLETLVFYIEIAMRRTVEDCGGLQPSRDLIMVAAAICQLLGGWPLTRACYAEAPRQVLKLVNRAVEIDPYLKRLLTEIAQLTKFPPDARKPTKWVINVIIEAFERQRAGGKRLGKVTAADFIKWSVLTLSPGVRRTFAPGVKPQLQQKLDRLIATITAHVFASPQLKELILNCGGAQTAAHNIVSSLIRRNCRELALPNVQNLLDTYRQNLHANGIPAAQEHFDNFVEALTLLPQFLSATSPEGHLDQIVERLRAKRWLIGEKAVLLSKWDRTFLEQLAEVPGLHAMGRHVASLSQRPLDLKEWVRQSAHSFPLAAEFEEELRYAARRSRKLSQRLPEVAEIVQVLLRPAAKNASLAVEGAMKTILSQIWPPPELRQLRRLLRSIRRAAERSYTDRFAELERRLRKALITGEMMS